MNLLQLRTKFRELSGRFDLVNPDNSDNGADFFINEGRKFLDRLDETQKSEATCYRFLNINNFAVTFPSCRAIRNVHISSTEGRWKMEKADFGELLNCYLGGLPSTRTSGSPWSYAPCISRYIPENATVVDIESFVGYVEIPAGNAHHYNTILLSAPADQRLVVSISGLFYSMELVNDTDKNYWSEVNPLLLIMSAMRYVEVVNRNTQGVNDWNASIAVEMKQLGMDLVEEVIHEVDHMEG